MTIPILALSEKELIEIGKITAYFARLEDMVAMCIIFAIGKDQKLGRIFTTPLGFRQRVDLFSALYHYGLKNQERLEELDGLVIRLDEAGRIRNKMIHSIWAAATTPAKVTRAKPKSHRKESLIWDIEEIDTKELEQIGNTIGELVYDLEDYYIKCHYG